MKRRLTVFAAALTIAGSVTAGSALADTAPAPKPAPQTYLTYTLQTVYVTGISFN